MSDNKKNNNDMAKSRDGKSGIGDDWSELSLTEDMNISNETEPKKPEKKKGKSSKKQAPVEALGKIEPKKIPAQQAKDDSSNKTGHVETKTETQTPLQLSGGEGGSEGPDQEDVDYMNPLMASHMRKPKKWAPILLYSIVAFFVCAFIWANLAKLDEVTRGDGRVIPSGQVKIIDHLEGGIVKDILVKEGEIVEKGQTLLRIDSTIAKARYEEGLILYYQILARIARIKAQLSGKPYVVPEEVVKKAPEIAAKEKDTYDAAVSRLNNEEEIAAQGVEQRKQEKLEAQSRIEQLENQLVLAQEELTMIEPLVKSGVAPKVDWIRIKRDINKTKGELAAARANLPRSQAALLQSQQEFEQVRVNFRNEYYRELQEAERRWAEIKDATTTGLDRLTRTEVRSPVRGTIKEIEVNTIGGVLQPGQDLVHIVPLEDTLMIEAQVRPSDVAFLRPGMKAIIKITAYDFAIYGGLDAILVAISADTIIEENQRGEEEFFRIRLRTDKNYMGSEANPLPISPGMTAQVDILTGKKTVWQYIMKPILRATQNALTER